MTLLIHRQAAVLFACLIVLVSLVPTHPALAQSEGIDIEHSPNAKRSLRLHAEKLAELEAFYYQSLSHPTKRFEETCQRHITRYATMLDREMRTLTRSGEIEQAKAVQSAIQRAEAWTIAPPNQQGLHFLSKVDLEVPGSEKANKLGVDLLVDIQRAAETYAKQAERTFEQYKAKVQAARQALQGEMTQTLEQEQRAGRLEAVQEIQATVAALNQLPEVTRPEPVADEPEKEDRSDLDVQLPKAGNAKIPDSLAGFYSVRYTDADRLSREALIELRSDGSLIRGSYFYDKNRSVRWTQSKDAIKVTSPMENTIVLHFEENTGRDIVVQMTVTSRFERTYINSGSTYSHRSGNGGFSEPARCSVRKLGYTSDAVKGFEDGIYTIKLDLGRNPEGGEIKGTKSYRLEVTAGTFLITHSTPINKPDAFEPCMPTVLRARAQGADILLESEYNLARPAEMFVLRSLRDGEKEMQLWWDRSNFHKGQAAAAFGTLTKDD